MAKSEKELRESGYHLNPETGLWQYKVTEKPLLVPGLGLGVYSKYKIADKNGSQHSEDNFRSLIYHTKRTIRPFAGQPSRFTVEVTAGAESAAPNIDHLTFSTGIRLLSIHREQTYHASFQSDGRLNALIAYTGPKNSLRFYPKRGKVDFWANNRFRYSEPLEIDENKIAFGNLGYHFDQKPSGTSVTLGSFNRPETFREITVPTEVRIPYLWRVLVRRNSRRWIDLTEHIPVSIKKLD